MFEERRRFVRVTVDAGSSASAVDDAGKEEDDGEAGDDDDLEAILSCIKESECC